MNFINKPMDKIDDEYNISKYSDDELYKILSLDSDVSDKILETKIYQLINKYKNYQSGVGDKISNFFIDMHKHFFSEQEEKEVVENFETMTEIKKRKGEENDESEVELVKEMDTQEDGYLDEKGDKINQEVVLTKEVTSSKGVVNPLIQQTIQRVVSIDSQYREDKSFLATEFSFQLSEPLRDVVSLSLYSVQIPYTWYTVNSNFGSNFFFLKGDVPGINTGEYDYQIQIKPGNYTADNLVQAINDTFQQQLATARDTDFGNTNISYNVNNQITTLSLYIQKHYDELSYYLEFLDWTTSLDRVNSPRSRSILSFLGFQEQIYFFNALESRRRVDDTTGVSYLLPPTSSVADNESDATHKKFWLASGYSSFKILTYLPDPDIDGSGEYNQGTPTVDLDFDIDLTFDLSVNRLYSRNEIETAVNNGLTLNNNLINSSLRRVDISNSLALGGNPQKSIYSLDIYFDRNTTNNFQKKKTIIIFPDEPDPPSGTSRKVWTGATSCFRYDASHNELTNIVSEYKTVPQTTNTYIVDSNPYISLKCNKQYFDVASNDYRFTINNAPDGSGNFPEGYLLIEYVKEIDNSIRRENNRTIDTITNPDGDFDLNNTKATLTAASTVKIGIDLTKRFNTSTFIIEINETSFLRKTMNYLSGYTSLMVTTNGMEELVTHKSEFEINATYTCFEDLLLTVKPHPNGYGNENMPEIPIRILPCTIDEIVYTSIPNNGLVFKTYMEMQTAINAAIDRTMDYENFNAMEGSSIVIIDKNNEKLEASLTFQVEKFLSERDFYLIAKDPDYTTDPPIGIPTDVSNTDMSWKKNLNFFDSSVIEPGYRLSDYIVDSNPYVEIGLGETIIQNIMYITEANNTFWIRPYVGGVTDLFGLNDLSYSLTPGQYTRNQLVNELDRVIRTQPETENSRIELIETANQLENYTKIRIEVKKTYDASDFKIVFYDPFSFAACYPGVNSVRTATFDNTLGWTLGFREYTIYYVRSVTPDASGVYVLDGNTTLSTDLYNYLLITLDDFNQNRLNDGLVTIANKEKYIAAPQYANKSSYKCDPTTGRYVYETASNDDGNKLTQAQLYTLTEIANSNTAVFTESGENYGTGPFAKDVFGLIPIKTASLQNGNVYVEFGGTLQNQQRKYFGPVNINRMAVKLLTDKGDVVNLNGSNWSFSLVVEQLYQS